MGWERECVGAGEVEQFIKKYRSSKSHSPASPSDCAVRPPVTQPSRTALMMGGGDGIGLLLCLCLCHVASAVNQVQFSFEYHDASPVTFPLPSSFLPPPFLLPATPSPPARPSPAFTRWTGRGRGGRSPSPRRPSPGRPSPSTAEPWMEWGPPSRPSNSFARRSPGAQWSGRMLRAAWVGRAGCGPRASTTSTALRPGHWVPALVKDSPRSVSLVRL